MVALLQYERPLVGSWCLTQGDDAAGERQLSSEWWRCFIALTCELIDRAMRWERSCSEEEEEEEEEEGDGR